MAPTMRSKARPGSSASSPPKGTPTELPESVTALNAFIGAVAGAIEEKPAAFMRSKGRIALALSDDRSVTLRLGDAREPLRWEADPDAELKLRTSSPVLRRILDGSVDAPGELASGALALEGNIELLPPLFQLLERGKSMLAVRMGR